MGVRIEGACTRTSGGGLLGKGSLKLAVQSAKGCLNKIGMPPSDLDVLINTGVYRDENIGEPAISSMIQHDISANIGYPPDGETGTFSFDLHDGGCGVVTAMELISGFISSGIVKKGIVVTSDAEPFPGQTEGFDFVHAGGAVVLGPGGEDEGFVAFHSQDFPEHNDLYEARVVWQETRPGKGRNLLVLRMGKAFMSRCVDCAQRAVEAFMKRVGMELSDVDLVIPSISPVGFAGKFRVRMGLTASKVMDLSDETGNMLTAGPVLGLERAMDKGRFRRARNVLFVSVGAGITVSLALYRNPPPPVLPEMLPTTEEESIFEEEDEKGDEKGKMGEDEGKQGAGPS